MTDYPPTIYATIVSPLQTNMPAGTLLGTCTVTAGPGSVGTPTWSLGPSTTDGIRIDENGQLISTFTPLPTAGMSAQIIVTVDSDSNTLTVPIAVTQMPEFQGVELDPDQLLISPAGTLVGTLKALITTKVPDETITYSLKNSDWFRLDGNQLYLAAELPAGTYPVTIGVSAPLANQAQEYPISVIVNEPKPPPTLVEEANAILARTVVQVSSSANPDTEGFYWADMVHRNNITSIASAINAGLGLPSGTDTFVYPDVDNAPHVWGADEFMAFAKAVMKYVYDVSEVAGGRSDTLPSNVLTI